MAHSGMLQTIVIAGLEFGNNISFTVSGEGYQVPRPSKGRYTQICVYRCLNRVYINFYEDRCEYNYYGEHQTHIYYYCDPAFPDNLIADINYLMDKVDPA